VRPPARQALSAAVTGRRVEAAPAERRAALLEEIDAWEADAHGGADRD